MRVASRQLVAAALAAILAGGVPASPLAKPAPAQRVRSDQERARELVERAAALYREGKLVEAAALFLEAYALSNAPAQLRNAAKAYTDAGHLDDALVRWREYAAHPKLKDAERAEAKAQIALVEEKQRTERALAEAEAAKKAAAAAEAEKRAADEARAKAEAERAQLEAERAKAAASSSPNDTGASTATRPNAITGSNVSDPNAARTDPANVDPTKPDVRPDHRTDLAKSDARPDAATDAHVDRSSNDHASIGPYVALGAGGILAVAAGAVFAHASLRLATLDDHLADRDASGRTFGVTRTEAEAELSGVNTERNVSLVLGLAAVGAVGAGLVWALVDDAPASDALGARSSAGDRANTRAGGPNVALLDDGAWLGWSGRW